MGKTTSINRKRKSRLPELFGRREVAECLGVEGGNLQYIPDLPKPEVELACGPIWIAADIKAFAPVYAARRRKAA